MTVNKDQTATAGYNKGQSHKETHANDVHTT